MHVSTLNPPVVSVLVHSFSPLDRFVVVEINFVVREILAMRVSVLTNIHGTYGKESRGESSRVAYPANL